MTSFLNDQFIGSAKRRKDALSRIDSSLVWISSSGTLGVEKYIGLTKEGILASASSVNNFFSVSRKDVFGCFIDQSFIAGIALMARAYVADAKIIFGPTSWCPDVFLRLVSDEQVTIASLFPPQLFDLQNHLVPGHMKALLVGGGRIRHQLSDSLERCVFQSYALTEASSSVGIKKIGEEYFSILHHIEVKSEEVLSIRGPSVARAVVSFKGEVPTIYTRGENDWFQTSDLVELVERDDKSLLKFIERRERVVKVRGRSVSLDALESSLRRDIKGNFAIISLPHTRDDNEIVLCVEPTTHFSQDISSLPVIARVVTVEKIPITPTGKVMLSELTEFLLNMN